MPFRPCPLGCGRFLSSIDSHDCCLQCQSIQHAEAAFVDGLYVHCERLTMAALQSHFSLLTGMGGAPSITTRAGFSATSREPSASALGDLRIRVRASPPGQSPWTSHFSRKSLVILLCLLTACPAFHLIEDQMLIAASEDRQLSSEDEDLAGLRPSGVVATAESDPELMAMLSWPVVSIGLKASTPPCPKPSRRDDWFLGTGRGSQPHPALVPFFPEVHEELMKSWMAPFSTGSCSSAFSILTTLDGGAAG